jgi:hypothetical protein
MANYHEIKVVKDEMFDRYGGLMSVADLEKELGVTRAVAQKWAQDNVPGVMIGKRVKYETRLVAKAIVSARGFC